MMVEAAIAPGPAAANVEHCKFIPGIQLGDDVGIGGSCGSNDRSARSRGLDHRTRIMGSEQLPGECDVGDVATVGVDALIE